MLMKQLLFITVLFSASLFAQNNGFESGIMGGPAVSQIHGDKLSGYNKLGFHGGMFLRYDLSKKFDLQFELRYAQKGSRPTNKDGSDVRVRLNYVEMPLMLIYEIAENIEVEFGFSGGYLISYKFLDSYGRTNLEEDYRTFELANIAGVYYHFSEKMSANIKSSYSLIPIRKYYLGELFNIFRPLHNNNIITLSLYYHFK